MADFLFELGMEELPPAALESLSEALQAETLSQLRDLLGQDSEKLLSELEARPFATPRRLALLLENLPNEIPASEFILQGPPSKIAYNEQGEASKALIGFAKKADAELDQLEEINGKICMRQTQPAKPLANELAKIIEQALTKLPIPKRMRWGKQRTEFIRPVHWLVMLFEDKVINCSILGLEADRISYGHRQHQPEPIQIQQPKDYAEQLKQSKVLVDFQERKELIRQQVLAEAEKLKAKTQIDEQLLTEITALNEWPVAVTGNFAKSFLDIPAEALISSMKKHQKYFHHLDQDGNLLPCFTTVCNLESKDPQQVIRGNEKVIQPRLADAEFFFTQDKKSTLKQRIPALEKIVFQKDLGSIADKSKRVANLAQHIAAQIESDTALAERAALLAKTDLVTDMVLEFNDLQGRMGYYYAINDGEANEVAQAIYEQYLPRFSGDELPVSKTGIALALADRIDTLVGLFGIKQPPTGSKDPFALRRAALGVLRIIVEKKLNLDLQDLLAVSKQQYSNLPAAETVEEQVLEFMLERFRSWYDSANISAQVFLSVQAVKPTKPLDFDLRIQAINSFQSAPEAEALAAANKRVANILNKLDKLPTSEVNSNLLTEPAEQTLAAALTKVNQEITSLFNQSNYPAALELLAGLRPDIDSFFNDVMVNTEDEAQRNNRLALLNQLRNLFLGVADISLLS